MNITITPAGQLEAIDPRAVELLESIEHSAATRCRVSQVEPCDPLLRWLFSAIRLRVTDDSLAARFTRMWPCRWRARIFNGPTSKPFASRRAAIAWEIERIENQ